jgi:mRNA-degrading endonuclease toxin of MazEF toxin-antitoxin module
MNYCGCSVDVERIGRPVGQFPPARMTELNIATACIRVSDAG